MNNLLALAALMLIFVFVIICLVHIFIEGGVMALLGVLLGCLVGSGISLIFIWALDALLEK